MNRFSQAEGLIERAANSPAKRAKKLLKKAKKSLNQAKAKTIRAAKGKKPKISSDCAAALERAADSVLLHLGV